MFEFTGHYARDIGVAAITRFCGKNHPSELTAADIETVVEYVKRQSQAAAEIILDHCVHEQRMVHSGRI